MLARHLIYHVFMWALCGVAICSPVQASEGKDQIIRFGCLPVLQALPLYVAKDQGLFSKSGVNVEIITFNTAAEKDIALSVGSIDGCFADLVTPAVLRGNGRDISMVATNYDTRKDRRMFAVLGKPGGKYKTAADLADVPVAISSNTVIDYVTQKLLTKGGVPLDKVASVEAKNIGIRMQMLMSGQVEAATLPEPLVTAAIGKGAVLLADDSGLGASQTVLVFSGAVLKKHPEKVKNFLKAVAAANKLIKSEPDAQRKVMVKYVRLPEPLKDRYPMPVFPDLHAPDKEWVNDVGQWLQKRGVIREAPTYQQVVDDRFLP